MLNHIGYPFRKGDTLIEVMFAVGVFGLAAVGAISLMNRGLATAQNTLEVTMARQEIDGQAEILRFLHSAYLSSRDAISDDPCTNPKSYRDLWKCITSDKYTYTADAITTADSDFYNRTITPGEDCDSLFHADGKNDKFSIPSKSFILNYRRLGSGDFKDSLAETDLKNVISDSSTVHTTGTYPRLIFTSTAINCEKDENKDKPECNLSDASNTGNVASTLKTLQAAEGIWVTSIASEAGVQCTNEDKPRPDYYDFHIQTCWDAVAGNMPSTINSTVRLFNPDQVSLASKKSSISFDDPNWISYDNILDSCANTNWHSSDPTDMSSIIMSISCRDKGDGTWGHAVYDKDDEYMHSEFTSTGDNNVITFLGYHQSAMDEGRYRDVNASKPIRIGFNIKSGYFVNHTDGRFFIKLGRISAEIGSSGGVFKQDADDNNFDGTGTELKKVDWDSFGVRLIYENGKYTLFAGQKDYNDLTDSDVLATLSGAAADTIRIVFGFKHNSHGCNMRDEATITIGELYSPAESIDNDDCIRVSTSTGESIVEPEPEPEPQPEPEPEPEPDLTTMQGFQCDRLNSGNSTTLTDVRDNNTYTVARLPDGNCWMTQNLSLYLNMDTDNTLYPSTSDVSTTVDLDPVNVGFSPDPHPCLNATTACTGARGGLNKIYYNWAAATAKGHGSICPKGWKLPTKSQADGIADYADAFNANSGAIGGYGTRDPYDLHNYNYSDDSSNRHWWTSTRTDFSNDFAYNLYYCNKEWCAGNAFTTEYDSKVYAFFIRCVKTP